MNLHFGRALQDGMPTRGPHTLLREDEYDEYTDVTCDSEIDWFDIMDPEHKKKALGDYPSGRERVVCHPRKDSSIPGSQSSWMEQLR
jgi:hypothetical protein